MSDRSAFPNFFRTVPSDESLAPGLATLMHYYGWKQLSILAEGEPQFLQLLPLLKESLSRVNVTVKDAVQFTAGNLTEASETIFVSTYHTIRHKMYYPEEGIDDQSNVM